MTELVWRVSSRGDFCGECGDDLEPGDLAVWTDDYRCVVHDSCLGLKNVSKMACPESALDSWLHADAPSQMQDHVA